MIQISVYDNSGDMPKIVSDQRLGEAPESILKAKATLAILANLMRYVGSGTGYKTIIESGHAKQGIFK